MGGLRLYICRVPYTDLPRATRKMLDCWRLQLRETQATTQQTRSNAAKPAVDPQLAMNTGALLEAYADVDHSAASRLIGLRAPLANADNQGAVQLVNQRFLAPVSLAIDAYLDEVRGSYARTHGWSNDSILTAEPDAFPGTEPFRNLLVKEIAVARERLGTDLVHIDDAKPTIAIAGNGEGPSALKALWADPASPNHSIGDCKQVLLETEAKRFKTGGARSIVTGVRFGIWAAASLVGVAYFGPTLAAMQASSSLPAVLTASAAVMAPSLLAGLTVFRVVTGLAAKVACAGFRRGATAESKTLEAARSAVSDLSHQAVVDRDRHADRTPIAASPDIAIAPEGIAETQSARTHRTRPARTAQQSDGHELS